MKKVCLLLYLFFLVHLPLSKAQLSVGDPAPNFTVTDINGQVHNLYNYLDQGIAVFIDFSATWCEPCWNYHNAHHLKNIYDKYGPNGSGQVMVLFLEGSLATGMSQLNGQGNSTYGDWITGTPYPIIDLQSNSIMNDYQIGGFPSVFGVCPEGNIFINAAYNQSYLESVLKSRCADSLKPSMYANLVSSTDETCPGKGDGSLLLNIDGYFPPYTVYWDNGMQGTNLSDLVSGSYVANVYDSEGFVVEVGPFTIDSETEGISATVTEVVDADCDNGPGSISIEAMNGEGEYTYAWSTGATTPRIDELSPGLYAVTISDGNECRAFLNNIEVGGANVPIAVTQDDMVFPCLQSFLVIEGLGSSYGPEYSALWTTEDGGFFSGENSLYPFVSGPGTYTLTVSNSDGCTASASTTVFENEDLAIAIAPVEALNCANECITIDASASAVNSNVTISWAAIVGHITAGAETLTPEICIGGLYRLTLTSPEGCQETEMVTINTSFIEPQAQTSTLVPLSCSSATGTLTGLGSTFGENYSYEWTTTNGMISSAVTEQEIDIASPGTYTLVVTHAYSLCTAESTLVVESTADFPEAIIATPTALDCTITSTSLDGSASVSSSELTYAWSTTDGSMLSNTNMPTLEVDAAGTYNLTVINESGCSATAQVVVEESADIPSVAVNAAAIDCDNAQTTLFSEVNMAVTYQWSGPGINTTNETIANPIVNEGGIYTLTVTAANGCTDMLSFELVADTTIPELTASGGVLNCATSSVQLSVSTNVQDLTYEWTGPAIQAGTQTANPTISQAGTYAVIATASNGCTATTQVVVEEDSTIPSAIAEGGILNCMQPTIVLNAISDMENVAVHWAGPNGFMTNEANPIVNMTGTYTLTVTGENACSATAETSVLEDTAIPDIAVTGGLLTCNENSLVLESTTNTNNLIYQWQGAGINSNNELLANPTISTPGAYTLTVTAENGCSQSATTVVDQNADIPEVLATAGTIDCNTSSVVLEASSATETLTYLWTGPNGFSSTEGQTATTTSGTYLLVGTSPNGCTATSEVVVNDNTAAPEFSLASTVLDCNNPTTNLTVNATTDLVEYNWQGQGIDATNANLSAPIVDIAGVYTLLASNDFGCTATAEILVEENKTTPEVTIETETLTCLTTAVVLKTNTDDTDLTYSWQGPAINMQNTNASNPEITTAGEYILIATASNGCSSQFSTLVEEDINLPSFEINNQTIACVETSTTLEINTTDSNLEYTWQGPGIDEQNMNLANPTVSLLGLYSLTAMGENGCISEASLAVDAEAGITATIENESAPNCFGNADGSIAIAVLSGTAPYTYSWSNGQTTAIASNLEAGTYEVLITDANGCETDLLTSLVSPQEIALTTSATAETTFLATDGTASVELTNGLAPFTYQWIDMVTGEVLQTTATAVDLEPGTYEIIVTDANACTQRDEVTIAPYVCNFEASIIAANISCAGGEDGYAEVLSTTSEVMNYTWSDGSTATSISNLAEGMHSVLVYDAFNCPLSLEFEISAPTVLSATSNVTAETAFQEADGTINLQIEGGTAPYTYQWSNGVTTNEIEALEPGIYTVLVLDANSCLLSEEIEILSAEVDCNTLDIAYESQVLDCPGAASGSINALITGTYGEYSINWNTQATTATISDLTAGTYTIHIEDEAGCTSTEQIVITEPNAIEIQLAAINLTCGEIPSAIAAVQGGTAPYTYAWSNGMTSEMATLLSSGEYELSVTDAHGCQQVNAIAIPEAQTSMGIAIAAQNPTCFDATNGQIALDVLGGIAPYDFIWQTPNSPNSAMLDNLEAGVYTVVVVDSEGCQLITSVPINAPSPMSLSLNVQVVNQVNTAVLQVEGGTPPYQYQWNDGHASVFYENISPADYSVTITDANGCQLIEAISVDIASAIENLSSLTSLELYPNPVKDKLYVDIAFAAKENFQIRLLDVYGQVHDLQQMSEQNLRTSFDTNTLASGTYLLQLSTAAGSVVRKVVVIH